MQLVEWDDKLIMGIELIDKQHHELVKLINLLYREYISKTNDTSIINIIEGLEKYSVYHFQTEEHIMRKCNYDRTNAHIIEHHNFQQKVYQLKNTIDPKDDASVIKLINFMRDWIINHIQGSDRDYLSCFMQNKSLLDELNETIN